MILSRFWYFVLTGAAVFAFATALLAASLVNDQWQRSTTDNLVRDRFEIEALMKLDARTRLDAMAPIAANSDIRSALRRASARRPGQPIDEELVEPLRAKLTELNGQLAGMRGDLLFAVDDEGWIVAGVAPGQIPEGAGLGQFPLVERALEGYIRDDVWIYNDGVYRMAARPVIEGGQYVGALVHGKRFDDELAELLSTRLDGASVAFFRGEAMFAGYMPAGVQGAPRRDDMGAQLGAIFEEHGETLREGDRTEPQPLDTGGLAVYSLVTGTARHANVGYAVARPARSLTQPMEILDHVSGDAWAGLPWPILGGAGFGVFLLAMLLVWLEHDRPLSKLRRAATALSSAPENRFTITDFGGRYRRVTESVNEALDKNAEAAGTLGPKRRAANLDELLGPADQEQAASGSFFGFANQQQADAGDFPDVPEGPGAPAPAAGSPAGAPPPPGGLPAPRPPAGAPPPPGGAARPTAPKPPPPKPPPPRDATPKPPVPSAGAPAASGPGIGAPLGSDGDTEEATSVQEPIQAPPPSGSGRKALKRTLLGVPPPSADDDEEEDGATMIARVPQELLEQSASSASEEERHFREVFDQFVAMKKKCGEPTTGLTFEKFAVTLRKNRDQIVKRHGANKVRFSVYEKTGKAALKATPIKE